MIASPTRPDSDVFAYLRDESPISTSVLARVESWLHTHEEVAKILHGSTTDDIADEVMNVVGESDRQRNLIESIRELAQNQKLDHAERIAEILHRLSTFDAGK